MYNKFMKVKENDRQLEKSYPSTMDVHTTLTMINGNHQFIERYCLEFLADGLFSDKDAVDEIVSEIAKYCLKEEFRTRYDANINNLPDDILRSFKSDAQKILDEMKSNPAYKWYMKAREEGILSEKIPPVVRCHYLDENGNVGVELFSLVTGHALRVEKNRGIIKAHYPDGSTYNATE